MLLPTLVPRDGRNSVPKEHAPVAHGPRWVIKSRINFLYIHT